MLVEIAVAAGAFLVVLLVLSRLLPKARPATPAHSLDHARRFVDGRIEQHIDSLTAAYLRSGGAEGSGAFTREVESFIGNVLMCGGTLAEDEDADLRDDVRELLVLDREQVYRLVLARVEQQLAQAAA